MQFSRSLDPNVLWRSLQEKSLWGPAIMRETTNFPNTGSLGVAGLMGRIAGSPQLQTSQQIFLAWMKCSRLTESPSCNTNCYGTMEIKIFELVCYILHIADQSKTSWWQGDPLLSGAQNVGILQHFVLAGEKWTLDKVNIFLAGEKCTLDKRVWWISFPLEIQLTQRKINLFFTGPQDISAIKVAEILTFALLQELQWWSEREVWSRWVYLESASWVSLLTAGVCCPKFGESNWGDLIDMKIKFSRANSFYLSHIQV